MHQQKTNVWCEQRLLLSEINPCCDLVPPSSYQYALVFQSFLSFESVQFCQNLDIRQSKQQKKKKDVNGPQNETLHQNEDLNSSSKTLNSAILSSIFLTAQSAVADNSNNMLSIIGNVNPTNVNKDYYLHRQIQIVFQSRSVLVKFIF